VQVLHGAKTCPTADSRLMKLSFIIPTLNEESVIEACLKPLQSLRKNGHEVIDVDGGSIDGTIDRVGHLSDLFIQSDKGRALQMCKGAAAAQGDVLIFLHADTIIDFDVVKILTNKVDTEMVWGHFTVHLSGQHVLLRIIEICMNVRSQFTGIATGDQLMFVTRLLYEKSGGFPKIELMEDIEFSRRLKRICAPICLKQKVVTSSRRWERHGPIKTMLKMWVLRLAYSMGVSPRVLAKKYG